MMMISAMILAAALGATQEDEASLTVTVDGLEPEGAVMMALFASAESWSGGEPVAGRRIAVEGSTVTTEFASLPAGDYAIRLFHDVDGDGELDTNLMGVPSEPFAFSNNALGSFGPAAWEDAVFTVAPGGNSHTLDMR
jgi:uncharacterized protein (DUF2141 family)